MFVWVNHKVIRCDSGDPSVTVHLLPCSHFYSSRSHLRLELQFKLLEEDKFSDSPGALIPLRVS